MIRSLTDFLYQTLAIKDVSTGKREHTLELCTAVLMTEVALADSGVDTQEQSVIIDAISEHFHLDPQQANDLLLLATQHQQDANSLHDFTRTLNLELTREEKNIVIELLWKIAAADSVIHKYEEYFIRKISDLLYVSHKDYIRAKHRASEVSG